MVRQALCWVLGSRNEQDRLGLCPGHLTAPWRRQVLDSESHTG